MPGFETTIARSGPSGLRVASGDTDTTLIGVSAHDMPKLPSSDGLPFAGVDGAALATLIDSVLFSVCQDQTRFHMNGVYLESYNLGLAAVSTDGHRLTLAQAAGIGGCVRRSNGVILPTKGARELVKLIRSEKGGAVSVAYGERHVFVRVGGYEMAIKTIDSQYPAHWNVIPTSNKRLVTVARKPLLAALKRMKPLCTDVRGVMLSITSGNLALSAESTSAVDRRRLQTVGEAHESLAAETKGTITIALNPKYLIEVLSEIDSERVTMTVGGELDPVLVRSAGDAHHYANIKETPYLGVIMPMRF